MNKEQLLAEAKSMYPKGTEFISPYSTEITVVGADASFSLVGDDIQCMYGGISKFVYRDGRYASIRKNIIRIVTDGIYTPKNLSLSERARIYAQFCDESTNHLYDKDKPYTVHLDMVEQEALRFLYLIPEEKHQVFLAGCRVHDVPEDCRQTRNDVKKELGEEVASIAFALQNEKGATRDERANDKYYAGIRDTPLATPAKFCDRIANAKYGLAHGSDMFVKYKHENVNFEKKMFQTKEQEHYRPMFEYLQTIFNSASV